jgi:hypothetical protein
MEKTALVGIIFIALVILLVSYSYTFLLRKSKIKILSNVIVTLSLRILSLFPSFRVNL